MNDYRCVTCQGPILDGHHVVLSTFVISVKDQQLANAKIYHEYCYRGPALGHLAKIERLQSQRDALVRKLGLDWGPDEFGDLDE